MSEYRQFLKLSAARADDEFHRGKIMKAINTHDDQVETMKSQQFIEWQDAREPATDIKNYVLANLPDLLEKFESRISANGVQVLWAQTAKEAQKYMLDIAREHGAKKIIKAKSMTTEEIDFNETCEEAGYQVMESDLGELIVQLAGEKPYHIVTPAIHKTRGQAAESAIAHNHHMIARLNRGHTGSDLLHHARPLVAHDHGNGNRHLPLHEVQVAVTQPCSHDLHENLVFLRLLEHDLFHAQGRIRLIEYGGLHGFGPPFASMMVRFTSDIDSCKS